MQNFVFTWGFIIASAVIDVVAIIIIKARLNEANAAVSLAGCLGECVIALCFCSLFAPFSLPFFPPLKAFGK